MSDYDGSDADDAFSNLLVDLGFFAAILCCCGVLAAILVMLA